MRQRFNNHFQVLYLIEAELQKILQLSLKRCIEEIKVYYKKLCFPSFVEIDLFFEKAIHCCYYL